MANWLLRKSPAQSWNGCEKLHCAPPYFHPLYASYWTRKLLLFPDHICGIPNSMTLVRVGKSGILWTLHFNVPPHLVNDIQHQYTINIKLMVWNFIGLVGNTSSYSTLTLFYFSFVRCLLWGSKLSKQIILIIFPFYIVWHDVSYSDF